jgi:hypothetical protein
MDNMRPLNLDYEPRPGQAHLSATSLLLVAVVAILCGAVAYLAGLASIAVMLVMFAVGPLFCGRVFRSHRVIYASFFNWIVSTTPFLLGWLLTPSAQIGPGMVSDLLYVYVGLCIVGSGLAQFARVIDRARI